MEKISFNDLTEKAKENAIKDFMFFYGPIILMNKDEKMFSINGDVRDDDFEDFFVNTRTSNALIF